MPDTFFSHDFSANYPVVQAIRAMFEAPNYMFWGKFMKYNTTKKKAVIPHGSIQPARISNSPIVVQRELEKRAGTKIEIPMFRRLKEIGKKGNEQLSGLGERRHVNFVGVWINEMRHAEVVKEGNMMYQVTKKYGIPETSKRALMAHWAERSNYMEIPYAMYRGLSYSVLNDTVIFANDTNVAARSHPHIFTAGQGKMSYAAGYPGNAGYEATVATAIDAIGPGNVLSASLLKAMNADDQIRRIPYLTTKDGRTFRVLVVDPYGMAALRNDADIKALANAVFVQNLARENPMLTGMEIFYEGWAIFDGGHAIYPISTESSLPVYGPETITNLDSYNDYTSYSKFAAMILGDNALFRATGWDLRWTGESRDHNHIEEVGYTIGDGFARADFWNRDDGTTGQYLINDTSALLFYYATPPVF